MASLEFPFLDLFHALRREGMALSPEQYDLLRQALGQGLGLDNWTGHNWDDLRQVCRVLWVKPCDRYDGDLFDQVFDQYVADKRRTIQALKRKAESEFPPPSTPEPPRRQWPQVPPGKRPAIDEPSPPEKQVPVAAANLGLEGLPEVDASQFTLTPRHLPLPRRAVLDSWHLLRRPGREGLRNELDMEATIHRISQAGYFSDVVMRPVKNKRVDLVVLVDDGNVMLPYRPALAPLMEAIATHQITPATLYRFTTYPQRYVYAWNQRTQVVPVSRMLSHMHRRRTIVLIWSDAGATQISPTVAHRDGLKAFLTRLTPCIRSLIWLNPLPPERWQGTLAAEVAYWLDGRMTHLSVPQVLALAKQPVEKDHLFLRLPDGEVGPW
ncbi:MAG: hypothetical protein ACFCVB_08925 [Nodosilinea sp.]